ncbi:MAG: hypothetical protein J5776_02255 [Clostridiales bacterium]|nr:hypothetical protein [Clostridiales bacterium]
MATLCKNCAHALVFDPTTQKLVCNACGSSFAPEEIESEAKEYRQDLKAETAEQTYGTEAKQYMDCYVYSCAECGGEIIINGTEASTTCVYCGNPNVVFSRIAKQKCPEYIMPFAITKEKAIELVHKKIDHGIFIPREIKRFKPDCVRGIYIPYWIVNADFTDAVVIKGQVKSGKNYVTRYFGSAGSMKLKALPIDASRALSDESSSKLEPFATSHLKPFDEDYLAGFYSNVSDVTYSDVRFAALNRAKEYFEEEAINNVKATNKKVTDSCPHIKLDNDMAYAMLPAWFITFPYKGKHNTILVNGDTGKVVCGLPWKRGLFVALLIILGITISVAAFIVLRPLLPMLLTSGSKHSSSSKGSGKIIVGIIAIIIGLFVSGINKVRKVIKNINLTQDKDIFNFTKKRQG